MSVGVLEGRDFKAEVLVGDGLVGDGLVGDSLVRSGASALAPAIWIFSILALLFFCWPLWRAQLPLELWGNEGWNAYWADAVRSGSLYPRPDALIGNNYPPLSFLLIDALSRVFGDPLYVGRALSLLATLGLGALAAIVVRQFGGSRGAGAVAALWFVATMARFFDFYVGMDDPQLLAQFVMGSAFAWFIIRLTAKRAVEPAIVAMAMAGFFKHDLIAMPATALLWLLLVDWRRGVRATIVGAVATAAGLALCQAVYGPNFIPDLMMPRVYYWDRSLLALGRLQFVLPAVAICGIWAWTERKTATARFVALFVAMSLASYLIRKSGTGVDENAQFDLVFATAIGVGMAFARLPTGSLSARWPQARIRAVMIAVLALRLVASTRTEFVHVLLDPDYRALAASYAAVTQSEATRIAALPGPTECTNLVVCRMANKAFVYDRFKVEMLLETHLLPPQHLNDILIRSKIATLVEVDPRANIKSLWRRYPMD